MLVDIFLFTKFIICSNSSMCKTVEVNKSMSIDSLWLYFIDRFVPPPKLKVLNKGHSINLIIVFFNSSETPLCIH